MALLFFSRSDKSFPTSGLALFNPTRGSTLGSIFVFCSKTEFVHPDDSSIDEKSEKHSCSYQTSLPRFRRDLAIPS